MRIDVSIVVPVYNVEKYLIRCIESILEQTLKGIEIILVDDGSADGSAKICDDYAKKESRIKVVHQQNHGLTYVRRMGVENASGEYVAFVDGDDWIDCCFCEKLFEYAKTYRVDIVTSRGVREYSEPHLISFLGDNLATGVYHVNAQDRYLLNHVFSNSFNTDEYLNGAVWNKLFKREIIKSVLNDIDDTVQGFMDDNVCVVGAVLNSQKIFVSDLCAYHHREREDSFTYSRNSRGLLQVNYAYLNLKRIIEKTPYKDELYTRLCEHTANRVVQAFNILFENDSFQIPQYLFKSDIIPTGSRVVIYGAGKVGMAYYTQFISEKKYTIVGIIDERWNIIKKLNILSPNKLLELTFDYVLIAVASKRVAQDLERELALMGVERHKIIWEAPSNIFQYYSISDR